MPPPSGGGDDGGSDDEVASAAAAFAATGAAGDDGDTASSSTTSAFARAVAAAAASSSPLQLSCFLPPPDVEEETTEDTSDASADDEATPPPAEDDIGHNLHTLRRRSLDSFALDWPPPLPPQSGSTSYASLPYGLNDHDELTSTVGTCSYSGRGATSSTPITPLSLRASTSGHGGGGGGGHAHSRHGNLRSLSHRLHKAAGGAGAVAAHLSQHSAAAAAAAAAPPHSGSDGPLETPLSIRLPPPHTSGPPRVAGGGVGEPPSPASWSSSEEEGEEGGSGDGGGSEDEDGSGTSEASEEDDEDYEGGLGWRCSRSQVPPMMAEGAGAGGGRRGSAVQGCPDAGTRLPRQKFSRSVYVKKRPGCFTAWEVLLLVLGDPFCVVYPTSAAILRAASDDFPFWGRGGGRRADDRCELRAAGAATPAQEQRRRRPRPRRPSEAASLPTEPAADEVPVVSVEMCRVAGEEKGKDDGEEEAAKSAGRGGGGGGGGCDNNEPAVGEGREDAGADLDAEAAATAAAAEAARSPAIDVFSTERSLLYWVARLYAWTVVLTSVGATILCIYLTMPVHFYEQRRANAVVAHSAFMGMFSFDFLLRLAAHVCTGNALNFVRYPLAWFDLATVAPFYLFFMVHGSGSDEDTPLTFCDFSCLRMIRAVVILAKADLPSEVLVNVSHLAAALKRSYEVLVLYFGILVVSVVVWSTAIYYIERLEYTRWDDSLSLLVRRRATQPHLNLTTYVHEFDPDAEEVSPFQSIFHSLWWGIATLATVGYGDMAPISIGGKVVAGMAMISGVFVLALPTSILGSTFVCLHMNDSTFFMTYQKRHEISPSDTRTNNRLAEIFNLLENLVDASLLPSRQAEFVRRACWKPAYRKRIIWAHSAMELLGERKNAAAAERRLQYVGYVPPRSRLIYCPELKRRHSLSQPLLLPSRKQATAGGGGGGGPTAEAAAAAPPPPLPEGADDGAHAVNEFGERAHRFLPRSSQPRYVTFLYDSQSCSATALSVVSPSLHAEAKQFISKGTSGVFVTIYRGMKRHPNASYREAYRKQEVAAARLDRIETKKHERFVLLLGVVTKHLLHKPERKGLHRSSHAGSNGGNTPSG